MKCKICSNDLHFFFEGYDDRYGYPGKYNVYHCKNCEAFFTQTSFDDKELGNLYSNFYPRSQFKLKDFKAHSNDRAEGARGRAYLGVPKNVTVLDIGCGFGESVAYHKNRGCDSYGIETDSNCQRVATEFNLNIKLGVFKGGEYPALFFDYITMDQVLEHVSDPLIVLSEINKNLKHEGFLLLSIPNANGIGRYLFGKKWIHWHLPYHVNFFSKKSIHTLALNSGFKVTKLVTATEVDWITYQLLHSVNYPPEGEKSSFWSGKSSRGKIIFSYMIIAIKKTKIHCLYTRLADLFNFGDNWYVELQKVDS